MSPRLGGLVAGVMPSKQETLGMGVLKFNSIDVVDVCPLAPGESVAFAALGRDGTLILSQDVLADRNPLRFKLSSIRGVAYRVISHLGDIYILTSKGLYVLANVSGRFVSGQPMQGSVLVLPLLMKAIDMNLFQGRWLLVAVVNQVNWFDLDHLHAFVPQHVGQDGIEESQLDTLPIDGEWRAVNATTQPLVMAA